MVVEVKNGGGRGGSAVVTIRIAAVMEVVVANGGGCDGSGDDCEEW
jgi:hypothetical protein